ncbi:phage tail spike protein [Marinilactibacillus sp. XAAS-LB27]|uniref:phage tail spike protein n=1 Tax=Marinilactibacillus sp. XAAS-LB27 TaxID=3114538 RepID=UPI002E18EE49|nr:phage tail spike protein [Marinilactibacillus sp. XAAS-LB27]
MYKVTLLEGPDDSLGRIIHSPTVSGTKVEGMIKTEINLIDSFNFSMLLNNSGYGLIKPLKTLVTVQNLKTERFEFEGRVLGPLEEMNEEGIVRRAYLCEGELGYLHDSSQRHLEYRGTPYDLYETILNYHNQQVEPYKRFLPGIVDVTNNTDNAYIYLSAEQTTFETIMDKLVNRLGGELRVRKENGVRYLDYLRRVGEDTTTEIKLAKNLVSITKEVDPSQIITRLTPLGIRLESENEAATDASQARLTIDSVNNGLPYIDRPDLISEFGILGKSKVWEDITLPSNLISTGIKFMDEQKLVLNQYKLTAIDLSLIGLDIDTLKVGNGYPTINPLMSIDETLRVVGKQTELNHPESSLLTIGDKFKTRSQYQKESNQSAQRVAELQNIVTRQSNTIVTLNHQVRQVNEVVDTIVVQFGNADIPGLSQSITNLNQVVDQLNIAIAAIPTYDLATEERDGMIRHLDKIKLNKLTIDQPIDIDQFKADFLELKKLVEEMKGEE